MRTLINRAACKEYALHLSKTNRHGVHTRVRKETLDEFESFLRVHINNVVHRAPSKKTL